MFVDDWHLTQIRSGFKNYAYRDERYFAGFRAGSRVEKPEDVQFFTEFKDQVMQGWRWLWKQEGPVKKLLMPVFSWKVNDETMVRLSKAFGTDPLNVELIDPSPMIPAFEVDWPFPSIRDRSWVLASRYDYVEWANSLGLAWPVTCYGHKFSGQPTVPTEQDLVRDVYARNWGVLSHSYPPYLVGQWRNRYQFAARAGSILYVPDDEAGELGEVYDFDPGTVEKMGTDDLLAMAAYQSTVLDSQVWSEDRYISTINRLLKEALQQG